MNLSSKLIENTVNQFSKLPGIGKKSALRMVLHLLNQSKELSNDLGNSIIELKEKIRFCSICFNVSDTEQCAICSAPNRNKAIVCVVESIRDVIAIENTDQYKGVYHVLGGVISPINGIGPDDLKIDELVEKVKENKVEEIIMALNPTMDGDTTIFYLTQKLKSTKVNITTLARGVAFGGNLEYVDELTLARSLATRTSFDKYFENNS